MGWSFPTGRLFGSELRIHVTFLMLLAWIGSVSWLSAGPAQALVDTAFVVALFCCVVAHEFGHALTARLFGIRTPRITLLPIGGLAELERIPRHPVEEFAITIAGPLVNVGIWLILTAGLHVGGDLRALHEVAYGTEQGPAAFLARLASVNLMLAIFNLIPAFPMDGGRIFRATLGFFLDRVRATWIAARVGQGFAGLFTLWGLWGGNPILVLIAMFIFMAAEGELRVTIAEEARMRRHFGPR